MLPYVISLTQAFAVFDLLYIFVELQSTFLIRLSGSVTLTVDILRLVQPRRVFTRVHEA